MLIPLKVNEELNANLPNLCGKGLEDEFLRKEEKNERGGRSIRRGRELINPF